jgi:type IV fimbrial biogenesis protein FimT
MRYRQSGISLLEVMAVVVIAGILLGLGMPSMLAFVQNGRMTTAGNDLLTAVMAGNAEAVKRRTTVTICRSASPLADAPSCNTGAGGWEDGWIVFVDDDADFVRDAAEEVTLRHAPLSGSLRIVAEIEGLEDAMQFSAVGRLSDGDGVAVADSNLLICDERGNVASGSADGSSTARAIRLSRIGRATLFRNKTYIDALDVGC